MMYTITDLRSLDVAELLRIAEELGVSHKKNDTPDALVYAILDKQAELGAMQNTKERKRKRARKTEEAAASDEKKDAKDSKPQADTAASPTPLSPEEILAQFPKHRGRKSKAELAAIAAAREAMEKRAEAEVQQTQDSLPAMPLFADTAGDAAESKPALSATEEKKARTESEPTEKKTAVVADSMPKGEKAAPKTAAPAPKEELKSKAPAVYDIHSEDVDERGVWLGDPGDGTDFIVLKDVKGAPTEDKAPEYEAPRQQPASHPHDNAAQPFTFADLKTIGVLELANDNSGMLRSSDYNYLSSPDDVYVSTQQVRRYGLKTGDVVACHVRPPQNGEKYYLVDTIDLVNGCTPEVLRDRIQFENLTPLFPEEKFNLCNDPATTNLSTRIVDLFSPIGKGQRALIVAQPKTGKTILMKDIANAIAANHPEAYLMMLLIDERPEEVTDMSRTVNAEVIASTFDEPAERHVKIATLVLEKAKRLVECGHDVVIFLDSITRLARAYNTVSPTSGRILSGGVEATALQKPKRFFGAARKIENGGSLTIIATALIDTGSKMDEVIFEEFKGTGNMELQLDRTLSNKRIFPAVNLVASSTRRDDLLQDRTTLDRMWILRKHIAEMNALEAMKTIYDRMQQSRDNDEFLATMNS